MKRVFKYSELNEADQYRYRSIGECIDTFERYANHKCPTGGFLHAVLSNDLVGSFERADLMNQRNLWLIVEYMINFIPEEICGSYDEVKEWLGK